MKNPSNKQDDFFKNVYEVVKLIPKGKVSTYGAIATYLGAKRSARMVGYALNGSFSLSEVPAHRVVNRLGILSGKHHFSPDNPMEQLLAEEGITVMEDKVQNFEQVFWDPNIELQL